jgi:hypothetical protein
MRQPRETRINVSEEMLGLFVRGLQLVAAGYDDLDAEGPEADEFAAIDKALCWRLLQLPAHCLSVFDPDLDDEMPAYMAKLASGRDWNLSKQWRKALQAAIDARGR